MCTLYFIHRSSIDQFTHTVFFSPRSRAKKQNFALAPLSKGMYSSVVTTRLV